MTAQKLTPMKISRQFAQMEYAQRVNRFHYPMATTGLRKITSDQL